MWAFCKFNNKHLQPIVDSHLGKGPTTKSDEFLDKFQTAFDLPPSHFRKIMLQMFYDRYGCIYARRYDGQIV